MTERGVDYSSGRPGGAALAAEGFTFAVRYLSLDPRGLTRPEIDDLHAHRIAIATVYETYEMRALDGYNAGRLDADIAMGHRRRIGVPEDRPVYFAIDFDAQPEHYLAIEEYFTGIASVIGVDRTGVYGGYFPLAHLQATRRAAWFWQSLAWSDWRTLLGRHLYQYQNGVFVNGAAVDYNDAYPEDFGQWPAPTQEEDMTGTQLRILRALSDLLVGPPDDENNADGDRAAMLDAEIELGNPIIERIGEQNQALKAHKGNHPGGLTADAVAEAFHAGADKILGG